MTTRAKAPNPPPLAVELDRWSRREHVSIATGWAPSAQRPDATVHRGEFTVVIRHGSDAPLLTDEHECRVEITGPGVIRGTGLQIDFECLGVDLYAIRDVLTAAIRQAEIDSARTTRRRRASEPPNLRIVT